MTVSVTLSRALLRLPSTISDVERRQLPFATAQALNDAVALGALANSRALPTVFDRPTPFTMRAVATERATKTRLQARVFIRPIQASYLRLQEEGGTRRPTRKALVLPAQMALNAYGNMPKGAIARAKARPDTFIGTVKGVGGLWQRPPRGKRRNAFYDGGHGTKGALSTKEGFRTGLKLLAAFRPSAQYKPRLGFEARAERVVLAGIGPAFATRLAHALATARPR